MDQSVARKAKALLEGPLPSVPPSSGRFSSLSIVCLATLLAYVVFAGFLIINTGLDKLLGHNGIGLAVLVILGAVISLFSAQFLRKDLAWTPANGRFSPDLGVRSFYSALKYGDYVRAYSCLSPLERLPSDNKKDSAENSPFSWIHMFTQHWKAHPAYGEIHVNGLRVLDTRQISEALALVELEVDLTLTKASRTGVDISIQKATETRKLYKMVHKQAGLWWMLSGQMEDALDRQLSESVGGPHLHDIS